MDLSSVDDPKQRTLIRQIFNNTDKTPKVRIFNFGHDAKDKDFLRRVIKQILLNTNGDDSKSLSIISDDFDKSSTRMNSFMPELQFKTEFPIAVSSTDDGVLKDLIFCLVTPKAFREEFWSYYIYPSLMTEEAKEIAYNRFFRRHAFQNEKNTSKVVFFIYNW